MRFSSNSDAYDFSWEQVAAAFWRKYPNPQSGHVLSEDIVFRYINQNGSLITKRLLTKTNGMPPLAERLVGKVKSVKIVEESVVDPVNKTLTTYTRNIGLTHIMQVEEKCIYQPDPANPDRTTCVRQMWVSSNLAGISRAVTKIGMDRLKNNVHKASQGFRFVLEGLFGQADKFREKAKLARQIAKSSVPVVSAGEQ